MTPYAPTDRDSGWSLQTTKVLSALFAVELVIGGPGFWLIDGISIRRSLVVAMTLWLLVLCLLGRCRIRIGHSILLCGIAVVMMIWIVLIPSLNGTQRVVDGIQEAFPLAVLFTGVLCHAYFRENRAAWQSLRRIAAGSLAAVALMSLAVWLVGSFLVDDAALVAIAFANYFTLGNEGLQPSLYVHRMPDGFFRVMWITSTLFVTGLIYCIRSGRRLPALLFAAALFVSYTRALWLCAVFGIVCMVIFQAFRGRRIRINTKQLVVVGGVAIALVVSDLSLNSDGEESVTVQVANRLLTTFSDESASQRVEQVDPLIDAWLDSPIFGAGMGSAASVSRSDVAPYLYELTYLALLMKVGVVGMMALAVLAVAPLIRGLPRAASVAHIDASIVAFLLACATNPYLLNLVGLGLLTFLYIDRDLLARAPSHASQHESVAQRRSRRGDAGALVHAGGIEAKRASSTKENPIPPLAN